MREPPDRPEEAVGFLREIAPYEPRPPPELRERVSARRARVDIRELEPGVPEEGGEIGVGPEGPELLGETGT